MMRKLKTYENVRAFVPNDDGGRGSQLRRLPTYRCWYDCAAMATLSLCHPQLSPLEIRVMVEVAGWVVVVEEEESWA